MLDHKKLNRLTLDLDLKRAEARGVGDLYHTAAELASRLAAQIEGSPFLAMSAVELVEVQIDAELARGVYGIAECARRTQRDTAREYRAARDRADELQRRVAALQAELAPLARLVERLTKYAAGSA